MFSWIFFIGKNKVKELMKKLLVTGASGFLGWNLCSYAKNEWKVFGTVYSHPIEIPDVNTIRIDLTDYRELKKLFNELRPDGVINTAASADPNFCQLNRQDSEKINVDFPRNMAYLCYDMNIPYVFTSTDLVFDGTDAPYNEDAPVSPVNLYGEQKVRAEESVLTAYPNAIICRMPLMFGVPGPAASSFIQPMLEAFKNGKEQTLFIDEYRTPVSGEIASGGLLLALEKGNGLIHLGGQERISRYNFGLLMMEALGINEARIVRSLQKDMPMAARRAPDLSLDSSKACSLGYKTLPLREDLKNFLSRIEHLF